MEDEVEFEVVRGGVGPVDCMIVWYEMIDEMT